MGSFNENNDSEVCEEVNSISDTTKRKSKLPKKGIIYLSTIPPYMDVTRIREYFEEFGKVDRVYLQLGDQSKWSFCYRVLKKGAISNIHIKKYKHLC